MPEEKTNTRRLAAILAADMVGYSRLMESDEDEIIDRQRILRKDVIDPAVQQYSGRIFKTTGDGLLAEFASISNAVKCAIEIQQGVSRAEADIPEERQVRYRIGINLGDIVAENGDVFGDGVNIAARIERIAKPGGVSVSDIVYQSLAGKLALGFRDAGKHSLKNIKKPVRIWEWRDDPNVRDGKAAGAKTTAELQQDIRFCKSSDGTTIAYATVGQGPPLFKAPNWMNHLEYDWESPVWRHLFRELCAHHTLTRFDQRANGLSDWDVADISFETMIADMEAVVDAAGLDRFPLMGVSQGCAYSIAYAVRHPERVSRLVLYGGFAKGVMHSKREDEKQAFELQRQMILQGWGQNNPAFRQFFTSLFMPRATKEQMDSFNELQRRTGTPENVVRLRDVAGNVDVADLLGRISVPTLVLHCKGDVIAPFEAGRRMAARIPGARFVPFEGDNHLIMEEEPSWPRFIDEVLRFLAEPDAPSS